MHRVSSIEELLKISEDGHEITADIHPWFNKPRKAHYLLKYSCASVAKAIYGCGVFCPAIDGGAKNDQPVSLEEVQRGIRGLGLSTRILADKMGVSPQAVNKFLRAKKSKQDTIKRYKDGLL